MVHVIAHVRATRMTASTRIAVRSSSVTLAIDSGMTKTIVSRICAKG